MRLVPARTTTPKRVRGLEEALEGVPVVRSPVSASRDCWEGRCGQLIQARLAHCTAGRSSHVGKTHDSCPGREGGRKGKTTPAESRMRRGR